MSHVTKVEPMFPLRIIYADGQLEIIDSADDLLMKIDTIDTTHDSGHVWIRDDLGRTVNLRMIGGEVELFDVEP
ncbi:MAG: hypothetical protein WC538_06995 [Thermoanaerobaculia bacterium]|jgi:hypothetical protein